MLWLQRPLTHQLKIGQHMFRSRSDLDPPPPPLSHIFISMHPTYLQERPRTACTCWPSWRSVRRPCDTITRLACKPSSLLSGAQLHFFLILGVTNAQQSAPPPLLFGGFIFLKKCIFVWHTTSCMYKCRGGSGPKRKASGVFSFAALFFYRSLVSVGS